MLERLPDYSLTHWELCGSIVIPHDLGWAFPSVSHYFLDPGRGRLPEGDTAGLLHGRRSTASSPEDGVRVDPLRHLYAGLRHRRLAEVPYLFCNPSDCKGGGMFRPTVRRIWTGPAIQLHRSLALPLSRAPALLRCSQLPSVKSPLRFGARSGA